MLVYRVENANGEGMYQASGMTIYWCPSFESEHYAHPCPGEDPALSKYFDGRSAGFDWFFGFSSIEQLKKWLFKDDWRHFLSQGGFRIGVYAAPEAVEGESQAMFKRKSATRVAIMCLATLCQR